MKIIIAGAGKVGFELARSLSSDHDVTVIDKNREALDRLGELIDIYPLAGDIENPMTYRSLLDTQVDLFIAVTDSDEANILSTLLATDTIRIDRRIIRLRNRHFMQSQFLASLGDLERVFPFGVTAETIRQLLMYPGANNVKRFGATDERLISVKVDNPLHETKRVQAFENARLKIVGIERDRLLHLPQPDMEIRHGDLIYFLGDGAVLESLYGQLDLQMPPRIETAVVFGADTLGLEIARVLLEEGVALKIVEKDIALCAQASDRFQDEALVINSRYDEEILYEDEQLDRADLMVATDRKDETNILRALQAKEHGIPKIVAINNERKNYPLMHQLGLIVARGPQMNAYYTILESIDHQEMVEHRHFCGGAGVIFVRVFAGEAADGFRSVPAWRGEGHVWIVRGGQFIPPEEAEQIRGGDGCFLITTASEEKRGMAWMRSL